MRSNIRQRRLEKKKLEAPKPPPFGEGDGRVWACPLGDRVQIRIAAEAPTVVESRFEKFVDSPGAKRVTLKHVGYQGGEAIRAVSQSKLRKLLGVRTNVVEVTELPAKFGEQEIYDLVYEVEDPAPDYDEGDYDYWEPDYGDYDDPDRRY